MKQSLRQLLLARHAGATPELDAIRRAVLPEPRLTGRAFLRELFVPARGLWTTLGAVWIAILVLSAAQPPRPPSAPPPAELLAAWSNPQTQLDAILAETCTLR